MNKDQAKKAIAILELEDSCTGTNYLLDGKGNSCALGDLLKAAKDPTIHPLINQAVPDFRQREHLFAEFGLTLWELNLIMNSNDLPNSEITSRRAHIIARVQGFASE